MKRRLSLLVLIATVTLASALAYEHVANARQEPALAEAIIGIWQFPQEGYYLGFDEEGKICYGGSAESVAAKKWCNRYTLEEEIVTETCMGGPEDRNCPLGGGSCQAAVAVDGDGQLRYRILYDACDMMSYKTVPPREFYFTQE